MPGQQIPPAALLTFLVTIGFVAMVCLVILSKFVAIWMRARAANAPVDFITMFGMNLRRVPVAPIVDSYIASMEAGLDVSVLQLESHHLAGGNVSNVIIALIGAKSAGVELNFNRAAAIDLASKITGQSVLEAVQAAVASGAKTVVLKQSTSST